MPIVKASSKGQIVLPKEIRQKLDIHPGQKVVLRLVGDHAEIKPLPRDPIESLLGIFKDYPGSLADELLTERRKDREREETEIARFARRLGLPHPYSYPFRSVRCRLISISSSRPRK